MNSITEATSVSFNTLKCSELYICDDKKNILKLSEYIRQEHQQHLKATHQDNENIETNLSFITTFVKGLENSKNFTNPKILQITLQTTTSELRNVSICINNIFINNATHYTTTTLLSQDIEENNYEYEIIYHIFVPENTSVETLQVYITN